MASRRDPKAGPATFLQRATRVNRLAPAAPVFVPSSVPTQQSTGQTEARQQSPPNINHDEIAGRHATRSDLLPVAHPSAPRQHAGSTVSDWANFSFNSGRSGMPHRSGSLAQNPVYFVNGGTEIATTGGAIIAEAPTNPHTSETATPQFIATLDTTEPTPATAGRFIESASTDMATTKVTRPADSVEKAVTASASETNADPMLKVGPHRRMAAASVQNGSRASSLTTASVLQNFGIPSPSSSAQSSPDKDNMKREEPVTSEPQTSTTPTITPILVTPELAPVDNYATGSSKVKAENVMESTPATSPSATSLGPHHSAGPSAASLESHHSVVPRGHTQNGTDANHEHGLAVANHLEAMSEQSQQELDKLNITVPPLAPTNGHTHATSTTPDPALAAPSGSLLDDRRILEVILENFSQRIGALERANINLQRMLDRQSGPQ